MGCAHRHRVQRLDAIVLTHFHADHVGGLQAMLETYPGTPVYTTWVHEGAGDDAERRSVGYTSSRTASTKTAKKSSGEKGAGSSVEKALHAAHITPVELHPGERLDWPGGHADVLWPRRVIHDGSVQNNASLILDVEVATAHVLVLGDAEREAQAAVVGEVQQRASRRPYDIVKVAHHGSSNQEPRLYAAAAAPHAVIGVGEDNDYGHPSRKALAVLDVSGSDVERTDTQGDVTFMASGDSVVPVPSR